MVSISGLRTLRRFLRFPFLQRKHCSCCTISLGIISRNGSERHRQRKAGNFRCFPGRRPSTVGLSCAAKRSHDSHLGTDWAKHCPRSLEIRVRVSVVHSYSALSCFIHSVRSQSGDQKHINAFDSISYAMRARETWRPAQRQ